MTYKIEIRPLALNDIFDAYEWYESQKEGLGTEFIHALDLFYDLLSDNPHVHSFYEDPVRQGKIIRFPYVVVYEIFDDTVVIYSVFMEKQEPKKKRQF